MQNSGSLRIEKASEQKAKATEEDLIVKVKLDQNDEIKIPLNNQIVSPREFELPEFKFDLDWM